jgi:hypothetical protein
MTGLLLRQAFLLSVLTGSRLGGSLPAVMVGSPLLLDALARYVQDPNFILLQ